MADTCQETSVPDEYRDQASFFGGQAPLSLAIGYVVVLGLGIAFSIGTTIIVWLDQKFNKTVITSEQFNCAGRDIKTGLTASVIVCQWTWAATLLQSSNVAYSYGVSGPFWYASGATIQVLLFGILAIELKRKAPYCHTFLEIVRARWGTAAHATFFVFAILTNIIVTSMLLLGGAATVNALTGMDLNLASFLIPWGVIAYTAAGGLKATFLAAYLQTTVIMAALVTFVFYTYAGPSKYVGSASAMYDKLDKVANIEDCRYGPNCEFSLDACGGVPGNRDGSYLTMLSKEGMIFGIINIVGNFGTVFIDQSYWHSAIAATPEASVRGYLVGGMCWFTIPFALATSLGLSVVAMQLPVTAAESGSGLAPPAAALYMLGQGGAILMLIMLFMSITSTGSAELIAVSSLISFDIYRTYINPEATGPQVLRCSRTIVVVFGLLMGVLAIGLNEIGLTLGWVYLAMGVIIGSAVMPVAFVLLWSKCTARGAVLGAILGQICGIITWLCTASGLYNEIKVSTLGMNYPMLAGNVVSIGMGGIICIAITLMKPDNCTWEETKNNITMVEQSAEDVAWMNSDYEVAALDKSRNWVLKYGLGFTIIVVIIWPILSLPAGVFTRGYFSFWVAISCIWGLVATFTVVFLPLYESWSGIEKVVYGLAGTEVPVSSKDQMRNLRKRIETLEQHAGISSVVPVKEAPELAMMGEETKA